MDILRLQLPKKLRKQSIQILKVETFASSIREVNEIVVFVYTEIYKHMVDN